MVRRLTPAQARAEMQRAARAAQLAASRQQEAQKRALRDAQKAVQRHNDDVRRDVERRNRKIHDHNAKVFTAAKAHDREVRQYNSRVRTHNQKVENQRRRLIQEVRRLESRTARVTVTYRTSVQRLATSYQDLERGFEARRLSPFERDLLDRASEEAANSVYLANALEGDVSDDGVDTDELSRPSMISELTRFSADLVNRWAGALFALDPRNPDAARHFCTSAREVLTSMLDIAAPDSAVQEADPSCERTQEGTPSRRAKIRHLLLRQGVSDTCADEFVDADMDNALSLFKMFNQGTHGVAGRFGIGQLMALRTRVESSIAFLHSIV